MVSTCEEAYGLFMREDANPNVPEHGDADVLSMVDDLPAEERRRLIDLPNAARILGDISTREVEKRIDAGDLEDVKLGRRRLVVVSSIDVYIARLRQQRMEEAATRSARDPDQAGAA